MFNNDPHPVRVLGELIDVRLKAFLHLRRSCRAAGNLQSLLQLQGLDGDLYQYRRPPRQFSGWPPPRVHHLVGAVFAAHGAGPVGIGGRGFAAPLPGQGRVDGQGELFFPVEGPSGPGHCRVPFPGARDVLDDVGRMPRQPGRHHPGVDIRCGGQAEVFAGGHVTEEVRPRTRGDCPADGAGDVIVSGRDIRHQGAQDIKRRTVADLLLQPDVGLDLVDGHVAGALDHHLDAGIPGALGELPESQQFLDLGAVGGVLNASGTKPVAQGEGRVIRPHQFQEAIEIFVQRVFRPVMRHPCTGERTAPGDDVHDPALPVHAVETRPGHAAVHGNEIDAVLEMTLDAGEDLVDGHLDNGFALIHHGIARSLVQRHGADTEVGFRDNGPPDLVDGAAGRQIHDGVGTRGRGGPCLCQFLIDVGVVPAGADIGVDPGANPLAHRQGPAVPTAVVVADDRRSLGHPFTQRFRGNAGIFRGDGDDIRDLALAGPFHLCFFHEFLPENFFAGYGTGSSGRSCNCSVRSLRRYQPDQVQRVISRS